MSQHDPARDISYCIYSRHGGLHPLINAERTVFNGNPQFINGGQELLIREPGEYDDTPAAEEDTAEAEEGEEAAAEEAPAEDTGSDSAETEETDEATDEAAEEGEVIVVEGEPTEEAEETDTGPTEGTVSGICVAAFNDSNGNGKFDGAPESLKADAAITLFKDGSTVTTHITDGVTRTHCFENLEAGTYQVQLYPPANYLPTTADAWAISVAPGVFIPLEFGMQYNPGGATEVADASAGSEVNSDAEAEAAPAAAEDTPEESDQAEEAPASEGNGLMSNLGGVIVIVAVGLVLLAGAGVVMLRRS